MLSRLSISILVKGFGLEKGRLGFLLFSVSIWGWKLSRRIRTGYVPASWGHRQHPWRWQSSSWRAQCRWRHPWWRSQGKPWGHHGSPRRWGQRYAWLHHGEPDAWWRAWWCPGCYPSAPSCDAWRLPCRVPFLLCLVQSCWCTVINWCRYSPTICLYTHPWQTLPEIPIGQKFWANESAGSKTGECVERTGECTRLTTTPAYIS